MTSPSSSAIPASPAPGSGEHSAALSPGSGESSAGPAPGSTGPNSTDSTGGVVGTGPGTGGRSAREAGAGGSGAVGQPLLAATAAWPAERMTAGLLRPWPLRGFFLLRLPLALVAGLRLRQLDRRCCAVSVPYGWRTTNPFRSTYFAALSMAAELSTGALAMMATRSAPAPVAMLIVALEAAFEKKATGLTTFTCESGDAIFAAVAAAVAGDEPVTVRAETVGRAPDGQVVARFACTWSFKRRARAAAIDPASARCIG